MISEITQTPKALRLHIGVFGRTNAGKSTLINAVTGQDVALTSPVAGTTTDPVFKPMELLPLGPVVFIDTAGLDDESELGELRVKKTLQQLSACDAAIYVISTKEPPTDAELKAELAPMREKNIPLIVVANVFDGCPLPSLGENVLTVDLTDKAQAVKIREALVELLNDKIEEPPLTSDLVKPGDIVLLTAPQDIQAPKGRLILPEVQVLRDLLDNGAMVMTVTSENIQNALDSLSVKPSLVVTDSQIYALVNEILPKDIRLTSFSMLMAKIKADLPALIHAAETIDSLQDGDRVIILESCAHHAMDGDIARIKIPALLRKYTGKQLEIVNVSGQNVLEDIPSFKLAIHCGGCMVNRKAMLAKQRSFEEAGVPMTNFGVAIAYMNGMLKRVCY